MLIDCPSPNCDMQVEKTVEAARNHVRWHHSTLTDASKIRLRDRICKFVKSEALKTQGHSAYENQLTRELGIK